MLKIFLFEGKCGSGVTTTLLKYATFFEPSSSHIINLNHYTLGQRDKIKRGAQLLNIDFSDFAFESINSLKMFIKRSVRRENIFIDYGDPNRSIGIVNVNEFSFSDSYILCNVVDSRDILSGFIKPEYNVTDCRFQYFFTFTDHLGDSLDIFLDSVKEMVDSFWISTGTQIPEDLKEI